MALVGLIISRLSHKLCSSGNTESFSSHIMGHEEKEVDGEVETPQVGGVAGPPSFPAACGDCIVHGVLGGVCRWKKKKRERERNVKFFKVKTSPAGLVGAFAGLLGKETPSTPCQQGNAALHTIVLSISVSWAPEPCQACSSYSIRVTGRKPGQCADTALQYMVRTELQGLCHSWPCPRTGRQS